MTPMQSIYIVSATCCTTIIVSFIVAQFLTYGLNQTIEIAEVDARDKRFQTAWCGVDEARVTPGNSCMLLESEVRADGHVEAHIMHIVGVVKSGTATYFSTREGPNVTVENVFDRVRRVFLNVGAHMTEVHSLEYKKLLFTTPCELANAGDVGPNRQKYELTIL